DPSVSPPAVPPNRPPAPPRPSRPPQERSPPPPRRPEPPRHNAEVVPGRGCPPSAAPPGSATPRTTGRGVVREAAVTKVRTSAPRPPGEGGGGCVSRADRLFVRFGTTFAKLVEKPAQRGTQIRGQRGPRDRPPNRSPGEKETRLLPPSPACIQ